MANKVRIAHLVNPVRNPPDEQLGQIQVLTFESMRRAAEQASAVADVELLTTQYPEDGHSSILPHHAGPRSLGGRHRRLPRVPQVAPAL